ncbi:UrcA family protein [Sphingobium sp. B2D3A]|uniref:UrcA family protein n=1 Tax=unclassified Sphingobium TaxID=2611147 RepID=UPI002224E56F|nr:MULTISPECIES: UrcA family protein [unclassified Sphingobium]MCW2336943.1 UrcA family protein [Sphingobium sp. B2D3A]MCW2351363.1 UrcA family protein [Sphingobium sp. B12D2B]MCW2365336.1 UrcA family protein [Sphingobium sp. B7D2B]MCW2370585.1 UrcA family protein [Sphingobium sp. B11D3D]MCW2380830.1 UrcA family protein [Sphingobium sp. B2D3B]
MKIVAAALVAAGLLVGSSAGFAKPRENVEVRVSTDGVNFADAESVDQFRGRVAREIAAACNPGNRVNADLAPDFKCRKSMKQVSETRIAQLSNSNARMATMD